ncbi:MAG: histidine phosphatase family protein [Pseudomonadales bacterium]|nr:histidine phosphatase family protein [Pseudomonadales bacterium]
MRELILLRHGETEWNVARRLQGHGDSPLTVRGRAQARAHAHWLAAHRPDRILASPLGRTRETTALLCEALAEAGRPAPEPEWEPALKERSMGRLEGLTLEEIAAAEPAEHASRLADPWHYRPPGGENYPDLLARVTPLLDRLGAEAEGRVLLVAHGTLGRVLLGSLLGLERPAILRLAIPNELGYRIRLPSRAGEAPEVRRHRGREEREGVLYLPEKRV